MRPIGYLTSSNTTPLVLYEYDSLYNKKQYFAKPLHKDMNDLVFDIGNYQ